MNCLYITLFFNIAAGIVQTFIKSWNQLLYPRVIEVCRLHFETRHYFFLAPHHRRRTFSQRDVSLGEEISGNRWVTVNSNNLFVSFRWTFTFYVQKSYDGTHLEFGGTLDRHCHFKHVSLKQSLFYHCQTSTAHR